MPSFNQVILIGHLTRDPQIKQLNSGTSVTEFGIANNRKFKTAGGEEREEVLFVDCAAFGRTGEVIAQFMTKGKPIFIEGRLKLDQWEAQDGGKRSKLSVVVDNFQFLGGNRDGGDEPRQPARPPARRQQSAPAPHPFADDDRQQFKEDDIPF